MGVIRANTLGRRGRHGNTFVDVILAVTLLGIMAIGLARGVAAVERGAGATGRLGQATQVARNAVERLRAAGPSAAGPVNGGAQPFNSADEADAGAGGIYYESYASGVACAGGRDIADNAWRETGATRDKPFGVCTNGQRPVRVFKVETSYFDQWSDAARGGRLQYWVLQSMRGRDSLAWVQP